MQQYDKLSLSNLVFSFHLRPYNDAVKIATTQVGFRTLTPT